LDQATIAAGGERSVIGLELISRARALRGQCRVSRLFVIRIKVK
jgi:hypothetical protein